MKAIVCMTPSGGIGYNNGLPWHSVIDQNYFKVKTIGNGNNAVVMGYNTYRSLGYRALPNRRNYVLTRSPEEKSQWHGADVVFESKIENIFLLNFIFEEVFIMGGETIYKLFEPYYSHVFVTEIHETCPIDSFFPVSLNEMQYEKTKIDTKYEKNGTQLDFYRYTKRPPEDFL